MMPIYAIIILLAIATGLTTWFVSTASFIGYAIGMALGIMLVLIMVRRLGRKARHSASALNLLYSITKYKASVCHFHAQIPHNATATVYNDAHEYADLVDILKGQMKLPAPMAREATKHAMATAKDKPFEEKIRVALQYWGDGENNASNGA